MIETAINNRIVGYKAVKDLWYVAVPDQSLRLFL